MEIHNGVIQDAIEINGQRYSVCTYVEGRYYHWGVPWVTWVVDTYGNTLYSSDITTHTIEAAEENHKYVLEHIKEFIPDNKESEESDGLYC